MIFNRGNNGAEELRRVTSSYYANADFSKISGLVEQVESELAKQIGVDVMNSIVDAYQNGNETPLVNAAQRTVGYMSVMRYFRLNDISHETDGRKVKMDSDNERRPFEWQLERDDAMHMEEYYNSFDRLVMLLWEDTTFRESELYKRISSLCIQHAGALEWFTGVEVTPHLFLRFVPFIKEAQMYVEERLGREISSVDDEMLKTLAQYAVGNRALALFVEKTEMRAMPGGAIREAITSGSVSRQSTTSMLHDYHQHVLDKSEGYVKDMQCRRDVLANAHTEHLVVPKNDPENKYFIV